MIKLVTPEIQRDYKPNDFKIFLAGTIDNGDSVNWQNEVIWLMKYKNSGPDPDKDDSIGNIVVFNPRRENWNINATEKDVEKQILWEEDHLDEADLIVMVLADNSKSPISLLELGLYGPEGKMIVFCTDKFYRFTNVRLTCEKFNIPLVQSVKSNDIVSKIEGIYHECQEIMA